jgi:pimeloyl-ACP methyl ester carboxylesterase
MRHRRLRAEEEVPRMTPFGDWAAGVRAYAVRGGQTEEAYLKQLGKQLTPEVAKSALLDLVLTYPATAAGYLLTREADAMRDEEGAAQEYTETWCIDGKIGYVVLSGGARVRYLRVGVGPPLILMHTVRTQLDHFQLVIPRITEAFTVYALDFPGMGWSDIVPGAIYDEAALRAAVVRVVEDLDLSDVTLAGESMGATLSLTASVDLGDRVRRVVAFNTYDFADGVQRANLLARLVVGNIRLPGWGSIVARLESKPLVRGILRGGLHDPSQLPDHYLDELRRVGRRPGYPVVARAIYRNLESLIAARERYGRINVPVTLVYGDEDWSRPSDRQANIESVPGARHIVLRNKGHFTALEAPDDVARILLDGARRADELGQRPTRYRPTRS